MAKIIGGYDALYILQDAVNFVDGSGGGFATFDPETAFAKFTDAQLERMHTKLAAAIAACPNKILTSAMDAEDIGMVTALLGMLEAKI